jgi:hypothetical protein
METYIRNVRLLPQSVPRADLVKHIVLEGYGITAEQYEADNVVIYV